MPRRTEARGAGNGIPFAPTSTWGYFALTEPHRGNGHAGKHNGSRREYGTETDRRALTGRDRRDAGNRGRAASPIGRDAREAALARRVAGDRRLGPARRRPEAAGRDRRHSATRSGLSGKTAVLVRRPGRLGR